MESESEAPDFAVLIVEDSLVVRERLAEMLAEISGVSTVLAADAEEGARLFQEHRPRIAVLDIELPGGSGIDLLKHIKRDNPACLGIILTTYNLPVFRHRCQQVGADYFFHKSTEFERVFEVVQEHVAQAE